MSRPHARTLFVTGKGGAGKSLVAREVAAEAAARGVRAALVDAVDPADATDEHVEDGAMGVERIVLDPREALRRLLGRTLRFGFLADLLMDSRTFSAVAAAAPALADLVRVDCLRELAAGRSAAGDFGLVVVNAPASGHGVAMLEAPIRIAEIASGGPGAAVAAAAREYTSDASRFRVAAVALPEELSVVETGELHAELERISVAASATVVNGVYPGLANNAQRAWLARSNVSGDARLYVARRERQLELTRGIASPAGEPLVLPYLFDGERLGAGDRARLFERLSEPFS
jgi:anion-transporting  ArsA/GET3 family ATPase